MSLSLNVLAYIINIIKEVTECVQHRVWLSCILARIRINQNPDALRLHVYVNLGVSHYRVAIIVYGSRLLARDV